MPLYDKGRQKFAEGAIPWLSATIKAIIIDVDDYVVNLATHEWLSDIPAAARISTSAALSAKTTTNGVCGCGNITFSSVSGDPSEAMVVFMDTGTPTTSPLIQYTTAATGLPVYPSGGNVVVVVPPTTGLFKL
jgi:hypothetical protein